MSRDYYDYYNPLSSTYDPYTSAPYYQYLTTDPSGLIPNQPISSKKDIVSDELRPGTTTVYDTLPPPPKKFGITTSESFSNGGPNGLQNGSQNKGKNDFGGLDFNTIIIILIAILFWILILRTNKLTKILKKLKKSLVGHGTGSQKIGSNEDHDNFFE